MRWERNHYVVEMTNELSYSFGSADNARNYSHEYLLLEPAYRPLSTHELVCTRDGNTLGSAVLGASGGQTGVHQYSCVLLDDRCVVAIGDRVAALTLPELTLCWSMKADDATCFGLHLTADEKHVVVHGELEISKMTVDGGLQWRFAGRDIFTGECRLDQQTIVVTDFNGDAYVIDIMQGTESIVTT